MTRAKLIRCIVVFGFKYKKKFELFEFFTTKMTNPFMSTSNQSYGVDVKDLKSCNFFQQLEENQDLDAVSGGSSENSDPSLSFLYTRESDRIGAEVEAAHSSLSRAFEKGCEKRKWKCANVVGKSSVKEDDDNKNRRDENANIHVLYKHEPKSQNPLFTTTANEIGLKKPSKATYTTTRYARSQNFSKSFNRIMFQDQGLNTSLSRSNVHERLDHFV